MFLKQFLKILFSYIDCSKLLCFFYLKIHQMLLRAMSVNAKQQQQQQKKEEKNIDHALDLPLPGDSGNSFITLIFHVPREGSPQK